MQDRVPLYPGRVTLTPVSGQNNTYDMVRADQPTQEGTPLNKSSLLKDATSELYGLGADAVPDDVLKMIHGNLAGIEPVGTIKTTVRTDLDDTWLLCNGEAVNKNDYPALGELFGSNPSITQISTNAAGTEGVEIYGDTCVVISVGISDTYAHVCVSKDGLKTWSEQTIYSSGNMYLKDIACYNGTWVAVGWDGSGKPYAFTTTDPTGTWTSVNIVSSTRYLTSIACYNGTWVAVGYYNGSPYMFTTTNPSGTWSAVTIPSGAHALESIACYNGTWVAVGSARSSSNYYPYIYTMTNPAGTWTGKQIDSTNATPLRDVFCYNGTWVAVADDNTNFIPCVYVTTDPTGTWTRNVISDTQAILYGVTCCNGLWVISGDGNESFPPYTAPVFTTTDPAGVWERKALPTYTDLSDGVCCYGASWVIAGGRNYNSNTTIVTDANFYLPEISVDKAYSYIKAKE